MKQLPDLAVSLHLNCRDPGEAASLGPQSGSNGPFPIIDRIGYFVCRIRRLGMDDHLGWRHRRGSETAASRPPQSIIQLSHRSRRHRRRQRATAVVSHRQVAGRSPVCQPPQSLVRQTSSPPRKIAPSGSGQNTASVALPIQFPIPCPGVASLAISSRT